MENIILSGFGGQGILLAGKVLAQAALEEEKFTTFFPSYGAEIRGGTAHCLVIISDQEIASPIFRNPNSAIFLNEPSVKRFLPQVKKNGLIVINSSLVKRFFVTKDIKLIWIPATEIAQKMGENRVANLVALGAFLRKNPIVSFAAVKKALKAILTGEKSKYIDINLKALTEGLNSVK